MRQACISLLTPCTVLCVVGMKVPCDSYRGKESVAVPLTVRTKEPCYGCSWGAPSPPDTTVDARRTVRRRATLGLYSDTFSPTCLRATTGCVVCWNGRQIVKVEKSPFHPVLLRGKTARVGLDTDTPARQTFLERVPSVRIRRVAVGASEAVQTQLGVERAVLASPLRVGQSYGVS